MISQQIAKPSYVKTKAFGLCGTLAIATALLLGAGTVSADETTQPVVDAQPAVSNVYTADNAGNVTVTPSETVTPATETPVFTPPAPVESQPIGTVPNDAPVHYKPEFQGGIPGIPEVRELPPFEGGVIPNDAPILDLPELEIPEEPTKPTPEKPVTPKEVPNKPVDAPKTKEVEITEVVYKNDSEPKEGVNTTVYGGVLPNTGEKEGIASTLGLVVIAAGITGLTLGFKKRNEEKGE